MATVMIRDRRCKIGALYQWDTNQTLEIHGFSFATAPEVHFANLKNDAAVVVQSRMNPAGVVTVDIPNFLLEMPYDLTAWVYVECGNKSNTRYEIIIPVNPRPRPFDGDEECFDEEG